MSLRLPDEWLWDFWFAQDGPDVHLFYLHAPRALGDPDLRHHAARIGHAVSRDLRSWTLLSPPFDVGAPGDFDDLALWTGSVLRHGDTWNMFYTGASSRERGLVQRIGRATSRDLVHWDKHGLVAEADRRWYEKFGGDVGEESWRDPWVFCDEDDGLFYMLVTARANAGPADGRGVIGHAWSDDLRRWEVGPPLSEPGEFACLEVPQLVRVDGSWRLLFSTAPHWHSARRLSRSGVVAQGGTHYLVAEAKLGPYALDRDDFMVGDRAGRFYAGRLLEHDGGWFFFGWRQYGDDGRFLGELSDPMPVTIGADRSLSVVVPP